MALPEQIRKQTEAVQEMYKQINPDNAGGSQPTDSVSQDEDLGDNSQAYDESEANTATSSAEPEQNTDDTKAEETLQQKYRTLQGMYNAEVPRLHQQNREMQQRLQQMEQLIATMSSAQQPDQNIAQPTSFVTEKDVEDYGDSIDVMRKVSREELSAVAQRIGQLEALVQQMQNVVPQVQAVAKKQAASAEQQFWADLTSTVSNWREINDNQDFQTWLLAADPLTGLARQTYLEDAQRALDAQRVANFFRTWLESTGQAAVAQSAGRAPASNSELEKQVAPGRSRGAGAPQGSKGRTYSPNDITKFFNDVRSGKYKGRESERDRIERDIFAAQRENRIVNA